MAVVVSKNNEGGVLMDEVKELYFGNATLHLCQKDECDFEESKPSFLKFLEED